MTLAIDLIGFALIIVNVALAWRYGLLRRCIAAAGFYGGVGLATLVANAAAGFFYGTGKRQSLYADGWTFLVVMALATLAVEILGALYQDRIKAIASLAFDRTAAVLVGAALGFFEICMVCVVGLATGEAPGTTGISLPGDRVVIADNVRSSFLGGRAASIRGGIDDIFGPVLPKDLPSHLTEEAAP